MSIFSQIFAKEEETFGLDIGYESLKVVQLKKRGNLFHLVGLGSEKIPSSCITKKEVKEAKKIAEAIKKVKKEAKIEAKAVISGLPESVVFTKILSFPPMSPAELKQAVPFEASSFIPLSPEEAYIDFQVVGTSKEGGSEILVIAAPRSLVDSFSEMIKLADCDLVALETKPLAISRALLSEKEKDNILIIDLGAETTSFTVYDGGTIKITTTSSVGGNTVTRAIQKFFKSRREGAERMKREIDLSKKTALREAIKPDLTSLVSDITNAIKNYKGHFGQDKEILLIKLCGGGANMKGLGPFLEESLGIKTEVGNPFKKIENPPPSPALEYTTAIGLAERGF